MSRSTAAGEAVEGERGRTHDTAAEVVRQDGAGATGRGDRRRRGEHAGLRTVPDRLGPEPAHQEPHRRVYLSGAPSPPSGRTGIGGRPVAPVAVIAPASMTWTVSV